MPFDYVAIFNATMLWGILFMLFLACAALCVPLYLWYQSKKHFEHALENASDLVFFKINVPQDNEIEIKTMEQFYTNLLGTKDIGRFNINNSSIVSLELVGTADGIEFYIVCSKKHETLVEKAIHAVYSDAEITKGPENAWNISENAENEAFDEYYLSKDDYLPLQTYEEIELDPLNSLTSVMSKMSEGEALALQLLIRPSDDSWKDLGNSTAHSLTNKKDKDGNPKSTDKDREKADVIKSKTKKEGFDFVIRALSVGPTKDIAKANLKNLKNSLSVLNNPQGNKIGTKGIKNFPFLIDGNAQFMLALHFRIFPYLHFKLPYINKIFYKGHSVLNTKELATLYHLPNNKVKTPGINWLRSKSNIASNVIPTEGLYLGTSEFRGAHKPIHMNVDDRRRHMYILGQTGTGKSEFMKFLAIQDIKAGKGVAFMDPHGSAVKDILQQIPPERINDVIYFNPGDAAFPMGLNILDVRNEREQDLVINSFIELLYKLYDPNHQGIVGPQLERAVRNGMKTIMEAVDGGTLVEVMRLVIDEKFQKSLVEKVKDPLVKRYWTDEMANTQAFHKSEKQGYFVSKFDRFATEKIMRNIIGQSKSAFDFNDVMDQKKILLIDLNKGVLGEENSKFLGLLLIPRILGAAFARAERGKDFDDFYLYVDEFQNFSTPDFVTILSEARKYKLNLVVANQFLSQMTEDIRNAIFGNVGTLISFRVGQDDGKYMSEQFAPYFNETDLINLKVGTSILRLLVDGHPTPPFSLKTDWPAMSSAPRSTDIAQQIITMSQQKYGRPIAQVTKEINERSGLDSNDSSSTPAPGLPGMTGGLPRSPFAPPANQNSSFSSGQTPFSKGSAPAAPAFGSPFAMPTGMPSSPFARPTMPAAGGMPFRPPTLPGQPVMPRPMPNIGTPSVGFPNPFAPKPAASAPVVGGSSLKPGGLAAAAFSKESAPGTAEKRDVDKKDDPSHRQAQDKLSSGQVRDDSANDTTLTPTPPFGTPFNAPRPMGMATPSPFALPRAPVGAMPSPFAMPAGIPASPFSRPPLPGQGGFPMQNNNPEEPVNTKGSISLADVQVSDDNNKATVKNYTDSPKTFSGTFSTPPPRPNLHPKVEEGHEHKGKIQHQTGDKKDHTRVG